jgi:hypothetical protein
MYFLNRNFDNQESNYKLIFGMLFNKKTLPVTNLKK